MLHTPDKIGVPEVGPGLLALDEDEDTLVSVFGFLDMSLVILLSHFLT